MKYLVIHCAETPTGRDVRAAEIHRWHKERSFDGIGYNDVICIDGVIEPGRPYYWPGAHAKGHKSSFYWCLHDWQWSV